MTIHGKNWILNWIPFSFTQFILVTLFVVCLKCVISNTYKSKRVPPGPWIFPVVGNILQIGKEPWKTCLAWKKDYGPIISIKIANINAIVLTDVKLIREAFALPALSGRPKIKIFERPQEQGLGAVDGPLQIEQRQFTMKQIKHFVLKNQNGTQNHKFEDSVKDELLLVIQAIEEESKGAENSAKNCPIPIQIHHRFSIPTFSSIWSVFMGHRVSHDDVGMRQTLKMLQETVGADGILGVLPFFVPILPALFPEATGYNRFKRETNQVYDSLEKELLDLPSDYTPGQPTNFKEAYADMIQMNKDNPSSSFYPSRRTFPYTLFDLMSAAVETTGTSIEWALVALVLNPEVQNRVFEEIHSVCGDNLNSNFPTLLDRPKCPYTEAVVYEVLRRHPVLPFGVPHSAMEDVTGFSDCRYTIKKGSLILPNLYGIHMDPDVWGDPQNFRPERFLGVKGFEAKRNLLAFSSGRRSCVGESIAKDQMFLFIAALVQKFHIKADPENPPTLEPALSVLTAPKPFQLIFVKR